MNQQEVLKRASIINVKNKLELKEIYSKKNIIYVKCPFCCSKQGTMILNTTNNSYICKNCQTKGYAIGLYAKCRYITTKEAYQMLIKEEADIKNNLDNLIITNQKKNIEELDYIYQSFLDKLTLTSDHIMKLLRYGFSMEEIKRIGFKSIPSNEKEKNEICREFGNELKGIPGFFKDRNFKWTFKSHSGIFVPVIQNCKIIALRIHLDKEYKFETTDIWFSSGQENEGTKADNNTITIFPKGNQIQIMNKDEKKDIIVASEFILAYKLAKIFKNSIIVGVPNIITKEEIKKLNTINNVNKVHVVMDLHTVLHGSDLLLSVLQKRYDEENITVFVSLKDYDIPNELQDELEVKDKIKLEKIA